MLEPIHYAQRKALGPAILFALVAQPTLLFLLSALSLTPAAPVLAKPFNSVKLVSPVLRPFLPRVRPAQSRSTAPSLLPEQENAKDAAPLLQAVHEVATPPSQVPALRKELIRYRNDGLALKTTFTFLVTINQDWLRFLRAYGAELVLSPYMPSPGSPVLVYSIEDGTLADDYVPAGAVVRSVDGDVPIPGFSSVLRKAAAEFGHQPNVFVLYRPDVFWAMQGKTAAELRARHLNPDQIRVVQVRYVPVGEDYDISVERVVNGDER